MTVITSYSVVLLITCSTTEQCFDKQVSTFANYSSDNSWLCYNARVPVSVNNGKDKDVVLSS